MTLLPAEHYQHISPERAISSKSYERYNIKRGLRNADGTGVLAGITTVSNVHGYVMIDDELQADEGKLTIRGYDLHELVNRAQQEERFGFEELVYLLLFTKLPNEQELHELYSALDSKRDLPDGFVHSLLLTAPSNNTMNMMARSILNLYAYDEHPDSFSLEHEIDTALSLISRLPRIAPLSYYAHRHAKKEGEMIWHPAKDGLSTAETILYMLREDKEWSPQEARMLDVLLMVHAEHGGGNNSSFTCRCLSSSGTDPYSAYAGAIGSLKGPKHGGANLKVLKMTQDLMDSLDDWTKPKNVQGYLKKLLAKEAFDRSGLIYGMGHAVYTLSDPRTVICKDYASKLAQELGGIWLDRYKLLECIEDEAKELIMQKREGDKPVCANIDLYSGLIYEMLQIPHELFTPLFAMARLAGWSAHRFEELMFSKRIIRPGYKSIVKSQPYIALKERDQQ